MSCSPPACEAKLYTSAASHMHANMHAAAVGLRHSNWINTRAALLIAFDSTITTHLSLR